MPGVTNVPALRFLDLRPTSVKTCPAYSDLPRRGRREVAHELSRHGRAVVCPAAVGPVRLSVAPAIMVRMTTEPDALHTLARTHLPADLAARWTGRLRPVARTRQCC